MRTKAKFKHTIFINSNDAVLAFDVGSGSGFRGLLDKTIKLSG